MLLTMKNNFPKRNYEPRPRRSETHESAEEFPRARAERAERPKRRVAAETAWDKQAEWYDNRHGDKGDDFHSRLVIPAVFRQLGAKAGQKLLDVCCGQGVLGRAAVEQGLYVTGIDASPALIDLAAQRASNKERYLVGDARKLGGIFHGDTFDHAALVLAIQDVDPIHPVFSGLFKVLRPGGRVVIVMTHPCFRIPKRTMWGFDEEMGVQYRRLEGYMTPLSLPIKTHPGIESDTASTTSFHRPLHHYINILGGHGFGLIGCEELCSHRRGTVGVRSGAEDRAAQEFPVFLVLTAERLAHAPHTKTIAPKK
jgi:ubiquinone/menaquinone biosynthesis C-methylase UbiE